MNEDKKEALRREFSPLLDNELDTETRATVEAELAEDADALRELEAFKRVDALYRALPRHAAPDDFETQVHAALENNVVPFSPHFRGVLRGAMRWVVPSLAAAMILIVAAGLYFTESSQMGKRFQISKVPEGSKALDAEFGAENEKSVPEEEAMQSLPKAKEDMASVSKDEASRLEVDSGDVKVQLEGKQEGAEAIGKMSAPNTPPMDLPEAELAPEPATPSAKPMESNAPAAAPAPVIAFGDKEMPQKKEAESIATSEKLMSAESAAGSALMKDRDDAPTRQLQSTESPIAYFRMLREYRAKTAELREKQNAGKPIEVAGRIFTLEQAVWVEGSYKDEEPEYVELGSEAYEALATEHQELREMVKLGAFVLVSFDGVWHFVYRLEAGNEK